MQIKKAGVVATGALATVAVMGAPAAASQPDMSALTNASTLSLARGMFHGPWDLEPQSLAAVGTGSVVNAAAWQICGSAVVAGVGGTVTSSSPQTVLGDCHNGNIKLKQDTVVPVLGVLNDAAISAATWQICGSTTVAGVGGTVPLQSPNTVVGDCKNGNIVINGPEGGYQIESATAGEELVRQALAAKASAKPTRAAFATRQAAPRHMDGWSAPWDAEPQALASVGGGSAVQAATWQICGSSAVAGVGGVVNSQSPNTVWGNCDNANVKITQDDPTAILSVLDNASINAAPWQICGSSVVAGVGGNVQIMSPNTVIGNCNNANTIID